MTLCRVEVFLAIELAKATLSHQTDTRNLKHFIAIKFNSNIYSKYIESLTSTPGNHYAEYEQKSN